MNGRTPFKAFFDGLVAYEEIQAAEVIDAA
jgi:hypothetical protein